MTFITNEFRAELDAAEAPGGWRLLAALLAYAKISVETFTLEESEWPSTARQFLADGRSREAILKEYDLTRTSSVLTLDLPAAGLTALLVPGHPVTNGKTRRILEAHGGTALYLRNDRTLRELGIVGEHIALIGFCNATEIPTVKGAPSMRLHHGPIVLRPNEGESSGQIREPRDLDPTIAKLAKLYGPPVAEVVPHAETVATVQRLAIAPFIPWWHHATVDTSAIDRVRARPVDLALPLLSLGGQVAQLRDGHPIRFGWEHTTRWVLDNGTPGAPIATVFDLAALDPRPTVQSRNAQAWALVLPEPDDWALDLVRRLNTLTLVTQPRHDPITGATLAHAPETIAAVFLCEVRQPEPLTFRRGRAWLVNHFDPAQPVQGIAHVADARVLSRRQRRALEHAVFGSLDNPEPRELPTFVDWGAEVANLLGADFAAPEAA